MTVRETDEIIIEALLLLMKEKAFDEISISDIVKRAGVVRGTFYRHFKDKEEVIKKYFEYNAEDFQKRGGIDLGKREDYYEIFFSLFSKMKENRKAVEILFKANLGEVYFNMILSGITEEVSKKVCDSNKGIWPEYFPAFVAGALYGITVKWISNGCKETVKEVCDLFYQCFPFPSDNVQ